ncbi:MAG: IS21 family transposase [Candidatus Competibacteraceae bacterium]|nr:IS21 family transposase [Candidatus Competibacteraceae bacterium]
MRKIREILRLKWACGLSARQVARSCGVARSSVADCLRRAEAVGLSWPLPESLDDAALERQLYPQPGSPVSPERVPPDWSHVHRELKRQGVTLFLLWQEYKAQYPQGYQYSRFCDLYRRWAGRLERSMRQEHRAGEKLFVDYAGQTVAVVDRETGLVRQAQVFVAVLGASNYTYAEATWSQAQADWLSSHCRALAFLGGVPEAVVPDNLKSAVRSPHRYEPDLNPSYQDWAQHYGVAVLPARVRRPRDKAKVEQGVLLVERWILARLRHQSFFSLISLNQAIRELVGDLNDRPFRKLPGCRRQWFEQLERPALRPLPSQPYQYAEWRRARVNIDYHLEVEGHYYSVPHALVRQALDVRLTACTVECFHRGQRVASHVRSQQRGRHTTVSAHMPEAHRQQVEWAPERFIRWAQQTGPATAQVVTHLLASRRHPQQGFRACLGVMRLGRDFGAQRLEAACRRALALNTCRYKSLESILKNGLDRQPLPEPPSAPASPQVHDNLRGPHYYH